MSVLKANVRVIPGDGNERRPAPERVQQAAQRLDTLGFTILRLGRFGVSVAASEKQFEQVFGCNPLTRANLSGTVAPKDPQLQSLVDAVEMAPAPQPMI